MAKSPYNIYVQSDIKERFKQEVDDGSQFLEQCMRERLEAEQDLEARIEDMDAKIKDQENTVEEEKAKLENLKGEKRSLIALKEAREEAEGDNERVLKKAVSILKRKRQEFKSKPGDWRDHSAVSHWAGELDMTKQELIDNVEEEVDED